jgi:hypothetical protein
VAKKEDKPNLGDLLAQAAEAVKSLPEDLRQTAFAKAVDILSAQRFGSSDVTAGGRAPRNKTGRPQDNLAPAVVDAIDSTAHQEIYDRNKALDRALIVLRASRKAGAEWLSAGVITRILREKFRLPANANAVSMALARANRLVDRRSAAGGYEYRLMAPGDDYLDNAPPEKSDPATKPGSKTKRPSRTSPTVDQGSRGSSRAGGLPALLREMIGSGFFKEKRVVAEAVEHLAHKKAKRFESRIVSKNRLSPRFDGSSSAIADA